ncbi:hypothetical protein MKK84_31795 [Methylobacterium sp. E-065]|uniref:hypothetical protein n=1 Tax=Methylobacterium sp. E-065 TaxID=2836583 RepID=UPI001FBB916D|nr:hypothetical protein [Methylobacterium sp. E-065]MCJ2021934.1 hypothetical protein [Methylobacterium sp. E-065]
MSEDDDQHRGQRMHQFSAGSNDKTSTRRKRRKHNREDERNQAVEIVDRLEQALRNLFK